MSPTAITPTTTPTTTPTPITRVSMPALCERLGRTLDVAEFAPLRAGDIPARAATTTPLASATPTCTVVCLLATPACATDAPASSTPAFVRPLIAEIKHVLFRRHTAYGDVAAAIPDTVIQYLEAIGEAVEEAEADVSSA